MHYFRTLSLSLAASALVFGCASDSLTPGEGDFTKAGDGKYDSSIEALFVDFDFDGELIASSSFGVTRKIEDQLLYTIGHLNGDNSVGRLDRLELSNIQTESVSGGVQISYHARLPVAWGHRDNVPSSYTFKLPNDVRSSALQEFTDNYSHTCVDFSAHDVTPGSMWYYYRTDRSGCDLDDADIVTMDADVSLSSINTTGKYPEYDKVYEDNVLRAVAVFGKFEDGATSNGDAGIQSYNSFIRDMNSLLGPLNPETTPADIGFNPGVDAPDIEWRADLPGGKQLVVNTLLVDNVRTAGPVFDNRYGDLSTHADLIVYSGHAGLGANIRALAQKGDWISDQYVVVFMNGCDTHAYVDDAIFTAHAQLNPGDPEGTKHVDMVTNAMPAFFHSTAADTTAFIEGLMNHQDPKTFEQIFTEVDSAQVVLVSGEQDNTFVPGGGGGGTHDVLDGAGTVVKDAEDHYSTDTLDPGTYTFELDGSNDADLYVRVGSAPTVDSFDCRPFIGGSKEICNVTLDSPAKIFVMVRGWAASSTYTVKGTGDSGGGGDWDGLSESGTVSKDEEHRFSTPVLDPGRYLFSLSGTNDADLYVRVGLAPEVDRFDCRPFKSGSNEVCSVDLSAPAAIHVMVRGWAASSTYDLVGEAE